MAVYRNDATLARIRTLFVIVTIVGLGMGAVGLARLALEEGRGSLAGGASVILAVIGMGGLFFLRRIGQVAVETNGEGIVVRNIASTRQIAWPDVEGFEKDEGRRGVTETVVRTSEGRRYPITACGDPGPTCRKIVEKLRKELAAAQQR